MRAWTGPDIPSLADAGWGTGPEVAVFDSAERRASTSAQGPRARLYVCGITPYDATHLGHAFTYVTFDLLLRAWLDQGLDVSYTQNVTDVDDPLLERAADTGENWTDLAERETELFRNDMSTLAMVAPQHFVGAVESIPLVTDLVQQLVDSGAAYRVDDDWYFDVRSDRGFGSVSQLDANSMYKLFSERGGDPTRAGKRDPLDCLLWQAERSGEPAWDSPLGRGRPGWHIECAAIALRHLGSDFDVQGGGSDLIFPHHEMSRSEAVVATGERFARAYLHVGMVAYEGEKMSKSKGNLVKVSALREAGVDPMAIRLALLERHYRQDFEWFNSDISAARDRLALWRTAVQRSTSPAAGPVIAHMRASLADDLDAPSALAAIDAWAKQTGDDPDATQHVATAADALLGVQLVRE